MYCRRADDLGYLEDPDPDCADCFRPIICGYLGLATLCLGDCARGDLRFSWPVTFRRDGRPTSAGRNSARIERMSWRPSSVQLRKYRALSRRGRIACARPPRRVAPIGTGHGSRRGRTVGLRQEHAALHPRFARSTRWRLGHTRIRASVASA